MTNNIKTVNIHGRAYTPVNERVRIAHEELKELSINTELISTEEVVVFKATVTTPKGTFTGYSAANPKKTIEAENPYEVAETSAVGRALGFAGYGITESIASADEMKKALFQPSTAQKVGIGHATTKQVGYIKGLLKKKGHSEEEALTKYEVTDLKELTFEQASTMIENLNKLADEVVLDMDEIDKGIQEMYK